MEFETARKNMVLSQLKPNKVTDERVLDAFLQVPREIFVKKTQTKMQCSVPIACDVLGK